MAKFYIDSSDNLIDVAKTVAANPNTKVVLNGTPISNQTLVSLASNQAMQGASSANAIVPYAGNNFTGMSNNLGAQPVTLSPSTLALSNSPAITAAQQSAANQATVVPYSSSVLPSVSAGNNFTGMSNNLGAQPVTLSPSTLALSDSPTITAAQQSAANLAGKEQTVTPLTTSSIANLGGAGTVTDANKINTQGNEGGVNLTNVDGNVNNTLATKPVDALTTSPVTGLATSQISTLDTKPISTLDTKPISTLDTKPISTLDTKPISTLDTKPITTLPTAGTQALTTADLATWGKTLPQGITADQLTAALKTQQDTLNNSYADALAGNQTALTSQNANFLKDWNTSADALKNSILTGVDTKNQQFGTQATQGFMDAFKNFQIPTNQQTGVNLGNYNDNRNAAADQWWSQYVTGRR
jgi:hypothetical protein